jgi:hypothetical protein
MTSILKDISEQNYENFVPYMRYTATDVSERLFLDVFWNMCPLYDMYPYEPSLTEVRFGLGSIVEEKKGLVRGHNDIA